MTTDRQIAAQNFLMSAEAELISEIKAGKDIDALAAELAADDSSGDLLASEIAWGLRELARR